MKAEQERRRVEELYVQGLRKLADKVPPDEASDLGYSCIWAAGQLLLTV
jgi:F-BAR domain only protein